MRNGLTWLMILGALAGGWYYGLPLWRQHQHARAAQPPEAHVNAYATWVDAEGVRHFSDHARPGAGEVVVDTGRIHRLPALPHREGPKQASDTVKKSSTTREEPELTKLGREMQEAQQRIRDAQISRTLDEGK